MRSTAGTTDRGQGGPASPLARLLFGVYVLLVAYASLYPLAGWRDHGLSPFAYLDAPLPRYFTVFDVFVNVLGYLPYGFLGVGARQPRRTGGRASGRAARTGDGR